MARKPTPPAANGSGPNDGHERAGETSTPRELAGPVAIARHVKDDGRALILYTWERPEPE